MAIEWKAAPTEAEEAALEAIRAIAEQLDRLNGNIEQLTTFTGGNKAALRTVVRD